jgi:hypothetical protein
VLVRLVKSGADASTSNLLRLRARHSGALRRDLAGTRRPFLRRPAAAGNLPTPREALPFPFCLQVPDWSALSAAPAGHQPRAEDTGVAGQQRETEHATARDDEPVCRVAVEGRWQSSRLRGNRWRNRHEPHRPGVCGRLQPFGEGTVKTTRPAPRAFITRPTTRLGSFRSIARIRAQPEAAASAPGRRVVRTFAHPKPHHPVRASNRHPVPPPDSGRSFAPGRAQL